MKKLFEKIGYVPKWEMESALREAAAHDSLMHQDMALLLDKMEKEKQKPLAERYIEKGIDGENLEGWLKMTGGQQLINWLENLTAALMVGIYNAPFTNDELKIRQGEVNALKRLTAMIKDIRLVKPEPDEKEGENNG